MFGSSSSRAAEPPAAHDVVSDEESDEALARRLQAEEEALARGHGGHPFAEEPRPPASRAYHEQLLPSGPFPGASPGGGHGNVGESDEEMARRLQMEEEENARLIDEMQQGLWDEDDLSNLRHPPPFHGPLGMQQLLASMRGAPLPQERPSVDPALMHLLPFLGLGRGPHPDPQALALLAMLGGGGGPGLLHGDVDGASYEELLRLQERLGIVSRGASAEQIAALPTAVAAGRPGKAAEAPQTCAVCLEDVEAGQSVRTLPCLHQFHQECVDRWLGMNRCCPVCKTDIC